MLNTRKGGIRVCEELAEAVSKEQLMSGSGCYKLGQKSGPYPEDNGEATEASAVNSIIKCVV